ncbi:SusD/RagB family nutrient-binding outer membrane lipoprotein [Bacteroides sp. 214]|uniref:SusD/RagB family nutrient-binding outer membrane lipoprotein n=1 Tax=Bacteroides sp. 214 TaxID=2302935 RepID=UPI0013D6C816|nr:SusD/RagB family nutrient-binding outer membrane lipoprotein [Bacteroides sp. 214]NDW13036.1 SusD/RagB family nutrient-binding outer membrane lipoprotein [Bacteroides sp. 214]
MRKIYNTLSVIGIIVFLTACTGSFEKYNTDKTGFPEEEQEYDYNKYGIQPSIIQKGIYFNYNWGTGLNWQFQIMQNLNVDMFAGYFHNYTHANTTNSVYNLHDGWNSSNWENTYGYIMPAIYKSEELTLSDEYPSFLGITKILKVATMHRIADQYGPLIYSAFGTEDNSPESLQVAYQNFFSDLEEGIILIQAWMNENPGVESFAKFDIITKTRTYDEWLRFANTLRLRLAIRVSNVDKAMAQTQVNKCFASKIGFLNTNEHLIAVSTIGSGYINPLGEINKSWGEVFMNANMESFLVGFNDPRLLAYFDPAEGDGDGQYIVNVKGIYKGIRQGTGVASNIYNSHSKSAISQTTNAILMTPAEAWFLRAEAALRGLTAENVAECYEQGVRASFLQWSVSSETDTYLKSERTPVDYFDAFNAQFDVATRSSITPKWEETDTNERKLERIITQKWLACYPEGAEAWAEQRRTGYPQLFRVAVNNSGGTINTEEMIRRLPYPTNMASSQYNKLLELLGGVDTGGTRLWWDVGRNVF